MDRSRRRQRARASKRGTAPSSDDSSGHFWVSDPPKAGASGKPTMQGLRRSVREWFDYETPVILRTKVKHVGIVYRLMQMATCVFVFGYMIAYLKGYQSKSDAFHGLILTEIRGRLESDYRDIIDEPNLLQWCGLEALRNYNKTHRFQGRSDIVVPLTIMMMQQELGKCPEHQKIQQVVCRNESDCFPNSTVPSGNGRKTGKCVPSIRLVNLSVCEIEGWCPHIDWWNVGEPSDGDLFEPPADNATDAEWDAYIDRLELEAIDYYYHRFNVWKHFERDPVLIIKNAIFFSEYHEKRWNHDVTQPTPCWDASERPSGDCPFFTFQDILQMASEHDKNVSATDLREKGGAILCTIRWECDFDSSAGNGGCATRYKFEMINTSETGIGRKSWYHGQKDDQASTRHEVQLSSVRLLFKLQGTAGKFDLIQLLFTMAAGLGVFSIVTLLCEYVFLNTNRLVKRPVVRLKYVEPTDDRDGDVVVVTSFDEPSRDDDRRLENGLF